MNIFLDLPLRTKKNRQAGLTILIDNGVPTGYFADVINSYREFIDIVKFGWCSSLITKDIYQKIEFLQLNGVQFYFGGTFFEKCLTQDKLNNFYEYHKYFGCTHMEISNGTIDLSNREKAKYIAELSLEFTIFSEVGYKDAEKSQELSANNWVEYIWQDLEAGATKVITEARESGRSGICQKNGELRYGIISEILNSGINAENLIFEAPTKDLQTYFITKVGANVNLANISFDQVLSLESLRLGLRSDTLLLFEGALV
ncbi:phosphosulfolactate synthase [Nostoc sp. RF31YmG]|nr:phosphosulfolactate synthase [Nostoc sp. RF31YmG]